MQVTPSQSRPLPSWAREMQALRQTTAMFVLSGNVRDVYLTPEEDLLSLPEFIEVLLGGERVAEVAVVRAGGSARALDEHRAPSQGRRDSGAEITAEETWRAGLAAVRPGRDGLTFPDVPAAVLPSLVGFLGDAPNRALVVLDASRAVVRPDDLTEDEAAMFRDIGRAIEDLPAEETGFSTLVWVVDAPHDVPAWLVGANHLVRSIAIPLPTANERHIQARKSLGHRYRDHDPEVVQAAQKLLVDQTDGMPLRALTQIVRLQTSSGRGLAELDDTIRVHRIGVLDNPWKDPYLAASLRAEITAAEGGLLRSRIRGQDAAVSKALDVLVRGVTGLRGAQAVARSSRPRGVLFFAGPTGVGKTELAKGLTQLIFGDEGSLIRFDMSEFASPHAVERLVGAPPGYLGFSQGGELTNAVRQRPFSLLLFDEIEKADHGLLDRFLQILDDGRLTDGRGETTYFTETVIVFTSNLGIYEPQLHPITGAITGRSLAVDPAGTYEELCDTVAQKVRDHFTSVVGRPELLNRIGDNIVVFDFIRPDIARQILRLMVGNVQRTYVREYRSDLILAPEVWQTLEAVCLTPRNLMMGGRGIGNLLETAFINPLARWAFAQDHVGPRTEVLHVLAEGPRYSVAVA